MKSDAKSTIETGKAILGIELGSTRIKAVLIDQENKPIAQGNHTWENQLVDGLWTYSIEAIWSGLQDCYADLRSNVKNLYGIEIENLAAIGVSAMMHGYMPFNAKRRNPRTFPYLEKYEYRSRGSSFIRPVCLQHSVEMEYFSLVPGNSGQRSTCQRH